MGCYLYFAGMFCAFAEEVELELPGAGWAMTGKAQEGPGSLADDSHGLKVSPVVDAVSVAVLQDAIC
jgi:hypothetical protein